MKTLGRYQIEGFIEKSGREIVYAAYDPLLQRQVEIRALPGDGPDDADFSHYAGEQLNAAHMVDRLQHPGIVKIYDSVKLNDLAYLVMQPVPGKALEFWFEQGTQFEPARAAGIVQDLLQLLQHVHDAGVLHRNLHAGCVIVDDQDRVRLTGFELARARGAASVEDDAGDSPRMSGRIAAMSPEQILGTGCDERTDLFQVGMLLYQLLTGAAPFPAASAWVFARSILKHDPPAPSMLETAISPRMDQVVLNALAKTPERRYASAAQFASALRDAVAMAGPSAGGR